MSPDGEALAPAEPRRSLLSRAYEILTRPLWPESVDERKRRRGRLMITGSCGTLVGLAFGVLAANRWGLPPVPLVLAGATGAFLVMYIMGQVESLARTVAEVKTGPASLVIRVGADVVGGAILGRILASVLGTDALTALAAGASILVAYSAVTSRLFWGGWVEGVVGVLTGQGGGARAPDYSYPTSLAARGLIEEAVKAYEEACDERPGHPDPMLHAAWTLREHREWEKAVAWYRRALAAPRIDARRSASVARQVWEIHAAKLGTAAAAIPDLAAVVERFPGAEEMEWARRELAELRAEEGGSAGDAGPAREDGRTQHAGGAEGGRIG